MPADRVVIVGNGRMAQRCAATLVERRPGALQLVVSEDRGDMAQVRLARWLAASDVPLLATGDSVNSSPIIERIAAANPDFVLSIDNYQLFGRELLALPRRSSVNFHNGLLDRYRGCKRTLMGDLQWRDEPRRELARDVGSRRQRRPWSVRSSFRSRARSRHCH